MPTTARIQCERRMESSNPPRSTPTTPSHRPSLHPANTNISARYTPVWSARSSSNRRAPLPETRLDEPCGVQPPRSSCAAAVLRVGARDLAIAAVGKLCQIGRGHRPALAQGGKFLRDVLTRGRLTRRYCRSRLLRLVGGIQRGIVLRDAAVQRRHLLLQPL